MKAFGMDISSNHGAVVEIGDDGRPSWFRFVTTIKKDTRLVGKKGRGVHLPLDQLTKQGKDRHQTNALRLFWWGQWLDRWIRERQPEFAGIEDYAFSRVAQTGHMDIAEITGTAKHCLWMRDVLIRLHEATCVKMFAAHHGHAEKHEVFRAVCERWWPGLVHYPVPSEQLTDLADACAIGRMVWTEARLRSGEMALTDLEHDKERQVFLRVTKVAKQAMLGREWIGSRQAFGKWADRLVPEKGRE